MRILVIDDERSFERTLRPYHLLTTEDLNTYLQLSDRDKQNVCVYARKMYDVYHLIGGESVGWDIVYLDHDLGNGEDVRTLTRDLEIAAGESGILFNIGKFVIHSMNPLGRKEMYEALHKYYNVSFARVQDLV